MTELLANKPTQAKSLLYRLEQTAGGIDLNVNADKIEYMAYERSETTGDNFGKFIHHFQSETKSLNRKLERILIKLYRRNVSILFNLTCLNPIIYIYIYIYVCVCVCVCVFVCV